MCCRDQGHGHGGGSHLNTHHVQIQDSVRLIGEVLLVVTFLVTTTLLSVCPVYMCYSIPSLYVRLYRGQCHGNPLLWVYKAMVGLRHP